jgi:predicted SAM-dependent methyltransferase
MCQEIYPDDEIELLNPFDYVGKPLPYKDGELDGLFAYFILNRLPYVYTQSAIKDWARCLKEGALLHVLVPSLEWICRAFLQESVEPHVKPLLFGTQTDEKNIGMNALKMIELRDLFEIAGLSVRQAKVSIVVIEVGEEQFEAQQHYVAGVKNEIST